MQTPLTRAGATSRRHHPNPAEAHGALAGRGVSRSGSLSVSTTHALFARKVQRKESNGVAGLAAAASSLDRQKSRRFLLSQRSTNARKHPCWHPGIRPELRFPRRAAQPRIVSVARIRLVCRKSVRLFKGIFCADVSEFESSLSGRVGVKRFQTAPSILV